jgi:hypothetical protein
MPVQLQALHLVTRDDHPGAIATLIQLGFHTQAGHRARVSDQLHHGFKGPQRTTTPARSQSSREGATEGLPPWTLARMMPRIGQGAR